MKDFAETAKKFSLSEIINAFFWGDKSRQKPHIINVHYVIDPYIRYYFSFLSFTMKKCLHSEIV